MGDVVRVLDIVARHVQLGTGSNDEHGWLIVPMLCGAMVVVGGVMTLLLDHLTHDGQFVGVPSVVVFVGGTILATIVTVAIIMAVAITRLGCCD